MASEPKRRCGYRKVGGLYLVGPGPGMGCCRLPVPLTVCPTCAHGIKPTRGWTWVSPTLLGEDRPQCATVRPPCPVALPARLGERVGLLWIGERFYPTPRDFTEEAERLGVSRRIPAVPRGFELGRTWVLLAHRVAIPPAGLLGAQGLAHAPEAPEPAPTAGIFGVFRPTRIEKIVTPSMLAAEREALAKKGITPVVVGEDDPDHRGTVYDDDTEPTLPFAAGGAR